MPQIDFDGANSAVKTDKIQGQSATTVTVPTGHTVAITDSGGLTLAGTAFPFTSAARAYRSTAQSIANGTWTKVVLDAESYDIGSDWDSSTNNRFDVPTTGRYVCTGGLQYAVAVDQTYNRAGIYVNGSRVSYSTSLASGTIKPNVQVTDILNLTAGQYVELYAYQTSGSSQNIDSSSQISFLAIHRIA